LSQAQYLLLLLLLLDEFTATETKSELLGNRNYLFIIN
jgi:hypothetical protein